MLPFCGAGSLWRPIKRLLAQAMAGKPITRPRGPAIRRRRWAMLWPSHMSTSGVCRSFAQDGENGRGLAKGEQSGDIGKDKPAAGQVFFNHHLLLHVPEHHPTKTMGTIWREGRIQPGDKAHGPGTGALPDHGRRQFLLDSHRLPGCHRPAMGCAGNLHHNPHRPGKRGQNIPQVKSISHTSSYVKHLYVQ